MTLTELNAELAVYNLAIMRCDNGRFAVFRVLPYGIANGRERYDSYRRVGHQSFARLSEAAAAARQLTSIPSPAVR